MDKLPEQCSNRDGLAHAFDTANHVFLMEIQRIVKSLHPDSFVPVSLKDRTVKDPGPKPKPNIQGFHDFSDDYDYPMGSQQTDYTQDDDSSSYQYDLENYGNHHRHRRQLFLAGLIGGTLGLFTSLLGFGHRDEHLVQMVDQTKEVQQKILQQLASSDQTLVEFRQRVNSNFASIKHSLCQTESQLSQILLKEELDFAKLSFSSDLDDFMAGRIPSDVFESLQPICPHCVLPLSSVRLTDVGILQTSSQPLVVIMCEFQLHRFQLKPNLSRISIDNAGVSAPTMLGHFITTKIELPKEIYTDNRDDSYSALDCRKLTSISSAIYCDKLVPSDPCVTSISHGHTESCHTSRIISSTSCTYDVPGADSLGYFCGNGTLFYGKHDFTYQQLQHQTRLDIAPDLCRFFNLATLYVQFYCSSSRLYSVDNIASDVSMSFRTASLQFDKTIDINMQNLSYTGHSLFFHDLRMALTEKYVHNRRLALNNLFLLLDQQNMVPLLPYYL